MEIKEGYKQTEVGMIPEDWDVKMFGMVGEIKMCRRIFNNETKQIGDIPFYKIGTFGNDADAFISYNLYNSYRQRFSFPKKGDILISAAGTIGRTIVYNGEPAYFQDSNIVWIDNNENLVSNKYIHYILQIAKYNTEGGTIQRLYNSILRNTKFACPPLHEQHAIAEVLSDADNLIQTLEKQIAKKRLIKQGVMQELLTPKEGWEKKRLGDVILSFQNGYAFSATRYVNTGIPIITMAQIGLNGDFNFNETKLNKWNFFEFNKLKDFHVNNGDLIIAMTDVTPEKNLIGRMSIVSANQTMLLNQRVGLLRLDISKVNAYFIKTLSNMENWRTYCIGSASLGVQANLSTKDILNGVMILPIIKEQNRISKILSELEIDIKLLEGKLTKYKLLKQGLMQQLLTGKIRLVKS